MRHTLSIAIAAALAVSMAGNIALTVKLVSNPPAHPDTLSIKAPSAGRLTLMHMYVAARMDGESVCLTDLPDGALWYHSCAQPGRWTR